MDRNNICYIKFQTAPRKGNYVEARLLFPAGPIFYRVTRILDRIEDTLGAYILEFASDGPRAPNILKHHKSIQYRWHANRQNLILQEAYNHVRDQTIFCHVMFHINVFCLEICKLFGRFHFFLYSDVFEITIESRNLFPKDDKYIEICT